MLDLAAFIVWMAICVGIAVILTYTPGLIRDTVAWLFEDVTDEEWLPADDARRTR